MSDKTRLIAFTVLILALIAAAILAVVGAPGNPLSWLLVALVALLPFLYRRLGARRYVVWKDEYSVGIESIDRQHKKLITLINSLQTAVNYSAGVEYEREALDELVDYTRTHFGYEEELMQKNGYPDFTTHRAEHELMVARVEQVLDEYRRNPDAAMQSAIDFLRDWLINHINGTDKRYSQFLIDRGVT